MRDAIIEAATAAGAIDAEDFPKILKPEDVKFDGDGKPENLKELVAALKAAKPYLFGQSAATMTPGEYTTARRDMIRGAGQAQCTEDERRAADRAIAKQRRAF